MKTFIVLLLTIIFLYSCGENKNEIIEKENKVDSVSSNKVSVDTASSKKVEKDTLNKTKVNNPEKTKKESKGLSKPNDFEEIDQVIPDDELREAEEEQREREKK